MKFIQKIGPFNSDESFFTQKNVNYLQIGVEHPYSIPIFGIDANENGSIDWPILLNINGSDFYIGCLDLLEFRLNNQSVSISLNNDKKYYDTQNDPYLIINVAYEAD